MAQVGAEVMSFPGDTWLHFRGKASRHESSLPRVIWGPVSFSSLSVEILMILRITKAPEFTGGSTASQRAMQVCVRTPSISCAGCRSPRFETRPRTRGRHFSPMEDFGPMVCSAAIRRLAAGPLRDSRGDWGCPRAHPAKLPPGEDDQALTRGGFKNLHQWFLFLAAVGVLGSFTKHGCLGPPQGSDLIGWDAGILKAHSLPSDWTMQQRLRKTALPQLVCLRSFLGVSAVCQAGLRGEQERLGPTPGGVHSGGGDKASRKWTWVSSEGSKCCEEQGTTSNGLERG